MSLTEYGRAAARLNTNTGAIYLHPYVAGEAVAERVGHLDEYGQCILVPHANTGDFFSFNEGATHGDMEYDAVHGEVLKCHVIGGAGVTFFNTDTGEVEPPAWDEFRPLDPAGVEKIIEPGLFLSPVDGDVAGGNMGLQVW